MPWSCFCEENEKSAVSRILCAGSLLLLGDEKGGHALRKYQHRDFRCPDRLFPDRVGALFASAGLETFHETQSDERVGVSVSLLFLLFLLVDGKDQSSAVDGEKYYALHLYPDADFCVGDGMSGRAKDMGQKADLTITRRCACTSSNFS